MPHYLRFVSALALSGPAAYGGCSSPYRCECSADAGEVLDGRAPVFVGQTVVRFEGQCDEATQSAGCRTFFLGGGPLPPPDMPAA